MMCSKHGRYFDAWGIGCTGCARDRMHENYEEGLRRNKIWNEFLSDPRLEENMRNVRDTIEKIAYETIVKMTNKKESDEH